MKLPSNALAAFEARDLGFRPLTVRYHLPGERGMLDNVQRDLDRDGVEYCLVGCASAVEVWRKGIVILTGEDLEVERVQP